MAIKKINTEVRYSVEMTQDQLDKVYALLGAVDDTDTDKLWEEMTEHVDDGSLSVFDASGTFLEGIEVS